MLEDVLIQRLSNVILFMHTSNEAVINCIVQFVFITIY